MGIIFGSARIDENGKAAGGSAGDQSGREVSTQAYYMHAKGWYCLRPKSVSVANGIAAAMQQACDNNNIGYDQNQRNTVMTQLKAYGSLAAIKTKCEADCSSLVRACIYQATGKDVGDIYTGNLASALENSGLFERRFSVSSESQLYNGDVLVTKSKGHTVVVVSGRPRSGGSSGGGTSQSFTATGTATCTGSGVNVRSGPGTNYSSYGQLGKGNRFEVDGKKSGNWVHIRVKLNGSNIVAWISGDYVKYDQSQSSGGGSSVTVTGNSYTVKKGDTLSAIAKAMGVSVDELAAYNGISNPDVISVGQVIKKPKANSGSSSLNETPQWVGKCTANSLHVRSWAGTENPNIKSWPRLSKGNLVDVCDTVKASDGSDWYYIRIDGRIYGFVSAKYIKKA